MAPWPLWGLVCISACRGIIHWPASWGGISSHSLIFSSFHNLWMSMKLFRALKVGKGQLLWYTFLTSQLTNWSGQIMTRRDQWLYPKMCFYILNPLVQVISWRKTMPKLKGFRLTSPSCDGVPKSRGRGHSMLNNCYPRAHFLRESYGSHIWHIWLGDNFFSGSNAMTADHGQSISYWNSGSIQL